MYQTPSGFLCHMWPSTMLWMHLPAFSLCFWSRFVSVSHSAPHVVLRCWTLCWNDSGVLLPLAAKDTLRWWVAVGLLSDTAAPNHFWTSEVLSFLLSRRPASMLYVKGIARSELKFHPFTVRARVNRGHFLQTACVLSSKYWVYSG